MLEYAIIGLETDLRSFREWPLYTGFTVPLFVCVLMPRPHGTIG